MSDITFEEAMKDLESIVRSLESGDLPLDKSLELFQKGVQLTKLCTDKLNDAEAQIKLLERNNGDIKEKDFVNNEQ